MLIALDYDKTYSSDPELFNGFINLATGRGHKVVCITMRHSSELIEMPCEIIYTGRKNKWDAAKEAGLHVDIWIDDSPYFILNDA